MARCFSQLLALAVLLGATLCAFGMRQQGGYGLSQRYREARSQRLFQALPNAQQGVSGVKQNYGPAARYYRVSSTAVRLSTKLDVEHAVMPNVLVTEAPVVIEEAPKEEVKSMRLKTAVVAIKTDSPSSPSAPAAAAAAVAQTATPATVSQSAEEMLRQQVQEEFVSRGKRSQELVKLQSQLSQSMERKKTMEESIIREVQDLLPRIEDELQKETDRVDQLGATLVSIESVLKFKTDRLVDDVSLLKQMNEIRLKISSEEDVIAKSMDPAISKKTDLVNLEQTMCDDVAACKKNMEAEIADAQSKLARMKTLVSELQQRQDPSMALRYTWSDVEALQTQLELSLENAKTRDEKVRVFMSVFDKATARKDIMLGFVKPAGEPTKRIDFSIVKQSTNDDLTKLGVDAAVKSATALAGLALSVMQATVNFARSSEGAQTREAATTSVSAVSELVKSAGSAWEASVEAWEEGYGSAMPSEDVPQPADYISSFSSAVKAVTGSDKVKKAVANISQGAQKSTHGAGQATTLLASRVSWELSGSRTFALSLAELQNGLSLLGQVIITAGERAVQSVQQRGGGGA